MQDQVDLEGLTRPLLRVFDELNSERGPPHSAGPSIGDTIHAQMLAGALQKLGTVEAERHEHLKQFLRSQPALAAWAHSMLQTPEQQTKLKKLLRIELNKS